MVHTLFLTDSRNFNPVKYTPYTVVHGDQKIELAQNFYASRG